MTALPKAYAFPVKDKYGFKHLEIGDSKLYRGEDPKRLRVSASMYGTRYGVWLTVTKGVGGMVVTRVSEPPGQKRFINCKNRVTAPQRGAVFMTAGDIAEFKASVKILMDGFLELQKSVDSIERQLEEKL